MAGWDAGSRNLNYDTLCGSGSSKTPVHVCFASDSDVTVFAQHTNFHGFHDNTGTNFVMFQSDQSDTAGMYQNGAWIVNVNFTGPDGCAAYDIQNINGQEIKNGIYCSGQPAISL
ncbi:Potassium ion channel Yvc1 [Pseudozyma hubeiensis]|nr:Potassium ion channel Yvc1 [Pseudozyma hubeiensis]